MQNRLKILISEDCAEFDREALDMFKHYSMDLSFLPKDGFKTIEMPYFKKFFSYLTEVMNYKCVFPEITKNYELQCEKKDISFLEEIKKEYDVKTLAIINKNTVSFSYNIKDK